MNAKHQSLVHRKGVTLLEMTVVLLVLLTLAGITAISTKKIKEWRLGREAGETLRSVYTAQRQFLADRPTTAVSEITAADLLPYMSGNPTSMPTLEALDGSTLTIKVDISPPVAASGDAAYDPSGSPSDQLWDVGQ